MGCDIHAHIEVKIGNTWHHYSNPPIQRCYSLFTKICGVRREGRPGITPISEPRGLPEDMSIVTAVCFKDEEADAHDMTWLNKEELLEVIEFHESLDEMAQHNQWGYLTGNNFNCDGVSNPPEITDARLICWFDN